MTAGITEILGAEPFPVRNTAIIPDRPRLLERLFEQSNNIGGKEEIREMDNQEQFPIYNDIVDK